jgi:hypothetical protein
MPRRAYDRREMSAALLAMILVASLLALVPVWRLHVAGWPLRSLFTAWVLYSAGIFAAVRFAGPVRFLVPILVLAYIAPFVAGPERLSRVLNGRRDRGVIIDVTPVPAPSLPEPPETRPPPGWDDEDAGPGTTG